MIFREKVCAVPRQEISDAHGQKRKLKGIFFKVEKQLENLYAER